MKDKTNNWNRATNALGNVTTGVMASSLATLSLGAS